MSLMKIPFVPYAMPQMKREMLQMRGINYSDALQDGDIADSYGISARRWPYISTRWARTETHAADNTSAIFAWDGHRVRVTGGTLYYDDVALTNVSNGPKQFAVVNTKLVIWPDQIYIDIAKGKIENMNARGEAKNATLTTDAITAELVQVTARQLTGHMYQQLPSEFREWNNVLYTYGTDVNAIDWNEETGWTLPTAHLVGMFGGYCGAERWVRVGDIFIPSHTANSFDYVDTGSISANNPRLPDVSLQNNEGYYAVVTRVNSYDGPHVAGGTLQRCDLTFDVYRAGYNEKLFSETLRVGDAVNVIGTIGAYNDVEHATIKSIVDSPNKLTFDPDTFKIYSGYAQLTEKKEPAPYKLTVGGTSYAFTSTKIMPKDSWLFLDGTKITVWDSTEKEVLNVYEAVSGGSAGEEIAGTAYTGTETNLLVDRSIPQMDYICESGNRLWGCSSEKQTVYASALGEPTQFHDFTGVSTDSYAVAVGSEGAFTGCCKYANSVLFFKEKTIHKVMGNYPATYTIYDYPAEGVQNGSYKSLQVVSGTLYYLGTHGVYGYTGGSPFLVSWNFGSKIFKDGVAGSDGDTYYLSVKEGENKKHLFLMETKENVWVREDSLYALDFARIDRDLRMLVDDGSVQQVTTQIEDPNIEWMVQFCPFYEVLDGKKIHSKVIARVELPNGSYLKVEIRRDGKPWEEVRKETGSVMNIFSVALPIGRCDKFELRFSGKGPCAILGICRQFSVVSVK